ncbi:DNA-binding response regulator, AraC family [Lachnospiraceae bacterium TWA4]|nr:DNA-binding response regulator, AraC family [Lachnospiraceae bacterium TWA4]
MVRAVICDDEKAALNIIKHFLKMDNLPIEIVGTAENGTDALKLIQKQKPDLVFMDIHMPFLNGFEVIEKLQDSKTKVIIITAYDSFDYARQALRLGACDILAKPIELSQLRQAINRAIQWNFTNNEVTDTILEYIYNHYNEQIKLEDLAKLTFCTESHISREFKKHTGQTIISYIHKVRIEKSVSLMEDKKLSIQDAADAVGYQNLNHFYRYFKQYMGETPAAYMKNKNK